MRQFMGTTSYHRHFVQNFAHIIQPLVNLTKSTIKYIWDEKCQQAFELIKEKLTKTPILVTLD